MRDSVGAVLRSSLVEDLHDFFAITVQSTDRLAQTALTWTGRQGTPLSHKNMMGLCSLTERCLSCGAKRSSVEFGAAWAAGGCVS